MQLRCSAEQLWNNVARVLQQMNEARLRPGNARDPLVPRPLPPPRRSVQLPFRSLVAPTAFTILRNPWSSRWPPGGSRCRFLVIFFVSVSSARLRARVRRSPENFPVPHDLHP